MTKAHTSLLDEITVDNFAGGGGASTGIELALGRPVDIAINHDPAAILMHKTNHPHTEHYQASVWDIDPVKVCRSRPVGLAWFSPDCKHFSKAKGGKPVDKNIRGLAWITLRWAGTVRPRVIILENVEEFQTWGPVRRGRPIRSRQGETFRKFVQQLRDLKYEVQWRELVAADYGVPTIRKRFFLIARCDGRPIVWPEPTHAPRDSEAVRRGEKFPWRSAAEIIDWTLPCPSIFDSKQEIMARYGLTAQRPLRANTVRRVARGLDKFVLQEVRPYLVSKAEEMIIAPALIQYHQEQHDYTRGQNVDRPLCTVDAANRYGVMAPYLDKYYGTGCGSELPEPLPTATGKDHMSLGGNHFAVVKTVIRVAGEQDLHHWPEVRQLLNTYCGYHLEDDEILLLGINDARYYISDVGLRMLTPRELYAANGFPPDYIIERDYLGNRYPKYEQVARCGNAVPPPFATALVRANRPDLCPAEIITTMAQLERAMAV